MALATFFWAVILAAVAATAATDDDTSFEEEEAPQCKISSLVLGQLQSFCQQVKSEIHAAAAAIANFQLGSSICVQSACDLASSEAS